jgi:hypothetical protein
MEHARPVTVHHNIATDDTGTPIGNRGYLPGQPVVPVYRYYSTIHDDSSTETDDDLIAEEAYWLFNVGHGPGAGTHDSRSIAYRAAGNRPLAVGDVLRITDTWWACTPTGWDKISTPAVTRQPSTPIAGTTPCHSRLLHRSNDPVNWIVYTGSNL